MKIKHFGVFLSLLPVAAVGANGYERYEVNELCKQETIIDLQPSARKDPDGKLLPTCFESAGNNTPGEPLEAEKLDVVSPRIGNGYPIVIPPIPETLQTEGSPIVKVKETVKTAGTDKLALETETAWGIPPPPSRTEEVKTWREQTGTVNGYPIWIPPVPGLTENEVTDGNNDNGKQGDKK